MLVRVVVLAAALLVGGGGSADAGRAASAARRAAAARRTGSVRRPPKPPRQPFRTLRAVYARSIQATPRYRNKMQFYAQRHGARFHPAPLKKRNRAREKMYGQFGGDPSLLTDVLRGTLELPDLRALYDTLGDLETHENVVMVRDRIQNLALGYPHVNVRFTMPDGLIVETQLTVAPFFREFHGEGGAHDLYEEFRVLDEHRPSLTPEQRHRRRELVGIMRRRFERVPSDYKHQLAELQRDPAFAEQFGDLVNPH